MILCFSGTGNTLEIAQRLADRLEDKVVMLTPAMRGARLGISEADKRIIWSFPIYSWGVPPFVISIIRSLAIPAPTLPHFMVATCGDDCGMAYRMWHNEIKRRGWDARSAYSVQMPNNYVAMKGFDIDPLEICDKKLLCAPARVDEIAADIIHSESDGSIADDTFHGKWARVKTSVIYPWFIRHAMSPRRFHTDENCISCGKCARICPMGNIILTGRPARPQWGSDCAGCLACYHVCPTHAVCYGNKTALKGQYMNPIMKKGINNRQK